jgi:hypothetical protein
MTDECKRHGCRRPAKRVFCSAECRNDHIAATRPRRDKHNKVCEQCGTQFIASRSHQRTCSNKCRVYLNRGAPKTSRVTVKAKAKASVRRPSTGLNASDLDARWGALTAEQKAALLGQLKG